MGRGTGAQLQISPALEPDATEETAPYRKPSTNIDFFPKYGPAVGVPQIQWGWTHIYSTLPPYVLLPQVVCETYRSTGESEWGFTQSFINEAYVILVCVCVAHTHTYTHMHIYLYIPIWTKSK